MLVPETDPTPDRQAPAEAGGGQPAAGQPGAMPVLTPKAEQTRTAISEAAMRLFERDGYDKTTMRAIATEAGVSVGNAYYYFGSKEHLIQAFYDRMQVAHAAAAEPVLAGDRAFGVRLQGMLEVWLETARPAHAFAGQFFAQAADPDSPLSPFSPDSAPARDAAIGLYRELVDGADLKLRPDLRRELPELLWLMQMGVVLFWVHDGSPDQRRTRALIDRIVPLVDRMVRMARLPVVRGLVDDITALVGELSQPL